MVTMAALLVLNIMLAALMVWHLTTQHLGRDPQQPQRLRARAPIPPPIPPPKSIDKDAERKALDAATEWEPYAQVNPDGRIFIGVWRRAEDYQFGLCLMYRDLDPDEDHAAKLDHAARRAIQFNTLRAR